MKKVLIGTGVLVASASNALASACDPLLQVCDVPEISALQGTAAIAAVAAVVLLVWERSRRAA